MLIAFVAATALLGGCATMGVGSYRARDIAFETYRTFDWGARDAFPVGDPRLDNNGVFHDRFQGAVEKALAARGFERVAPGTTADLLVHYHASVERRLIVNEWAHGPGCASADCGPRVVEFDAGTLVVDIVDAKTHRLVWRGWVEDNAAALLGPQDAMERHVDAAVARVMRELPRPLLVPAG
jgi:hypothetical protein